LLRDGNAVTVIDDCSTGRWENLDTVKGHPKLELIQSKVSECAKLAEVARECRGIYHLAAAVGVELVMESPLKTIETNLRETQAVLDAAGAGKTPVLLASTSEVYGKSAKDGFSEDDDLLIGPPQLQRWSYACSKLMDEFLALAHMKDNGTPVVIARLFNTVGPRQTGRHGMVLPRFIQAARKGQPLQVYGDGSQTRCFCYVNDTVEALVRLQNCPQARGQVFNVGSIEEVSIRQLAELVVAVVGTESRVELVPYSKAYSPGFEDMLRRKPIVDKLAGLTGFRPATTLRQIVEWTAASTQ
jgi:UDP-glucose 4-epimerase